MTNPLIRDRDVDFLLYTVLGAERLLAHYPDQDRESWDLAIDAARRLARTTLYPAYKPMDEAPPRLDGGRVAVHPRMKAIYPELAALGLVGREMPRVVHAFATAYLMAANLSAYGYVGLAAGAAHLLETFASEELRRTYMMPMREGRWLGTMALTEPQAGSSLADVATTATPGPDGSYRIRGSKIFISGGDHDLTDNIVHMVLARIDGAPAGTKGVSLFCVPKRRVEASGLVDNDIAVAGVIHKIGWRGLPSLALAFGDRGDCRGWLVGEPNRGLAAMFQMMNEARLMVGLNGVATASVAYHESLAYARERVQGRKTRDPSAPPVPIVEHTDVRRMLLRQKAIVEGGLSLIARCSLYADLAEHGDRRAQLLLDLLTPIAKSFPAERGFEANALAVQIFGGYGYTSEYPVEAWLRDQKLNSIHEGTTGIQAMDLLNRKVLGDGGKSLALLRDEIGPGPLGDALAVIEALTPVLASRPDPLLHAADYLDMLGTVVIGWQLVAMAAVAPRDAFGDGKRLAAEYWLATEIPRVAVLAALRDDSYARVTADQL